MTYKEAKRYKQFTVDGSFIKYNIMHWHSGLDGHVDEIGVKNYRSQNAIIWIKIKHVNLIEPDTKLQKQDPNILFKRRR